MYLWKIQTYEAQRRCLWKMWGRSHTCKSKKRKNGSYRIGCSSGAYLVFKIFTFKNFSFIGYDFERNWKNFVFWVFCCYRSWNDRSWKGSNFGWRRIFWGSRKLRRGVFCRNGSRIRKNTSFWNEFRRRNFWSFVSDWGH